jgi:hypothetical protein
VDNLDGFVPIQSGGMEVCSDMDESLSRLWSVPVVITPLGVDMGTHARARHWYPGSYSAKSHEDYGPRRSRRKSNSHKETLL